MITLTVLGCSDAFNSGGKRHTSFLLDYSGFKVLIDCGANTVLAFKELDISFESLDAVIITHFHGDHYGGLPYLILEAAKLQKRKKPLQLISPPGLEDRLHGLLKLLYPGSEDALDTFPIHYIAYQDEKKLELPFGDLTAYEVRHTSQTLPHGIRLETGGKTFAFSGDSGWHKNLIKLADNTDLFICECNFFKTETPSHLNYHTILEKQKDFNTHRLMLTHFGDEMLERVEEIKIERLQEGQVISF